MKRQRIVREFDKLFMERLRMNEDQLIQITTDKYGNKCIQIDWIVGKLKYNIGERVKFKPYGAWGVIRDIDPNITPHSKNYFIDFGKHGPHWTWAREDDLEVWK